MMSIKTRLYFILFSTGLIYSIFGTVDTYATSVTETYPGPGSTYNSHTNGSGTLSAGEKTPWMWTAGDNVAQAFTIAGLNNVDSFSDSFLIANDLRLASEKVAVLINGVNVGSFTVTGCNNYCNTTQTVDFNTGSLAVAIAGNGHYNIELELTNTISKGKGSIAFVDGNPGTLVSTPIPAGVFFVTPALASLFGFAQRKRRTAS